MNDGAELDKHPHMDQKRLDERLDHITQTRLRPEPPGCASHDDWTPTSRSTCARHSCPDLTTGLATSRPHLTTQTTSGLNKHARSEVPGERHHG